MKLTPVYTALLAAGLLAGCNESQTPATGTTGVTAAQKQAAEMALTETANTYTTAFLTQQPALSTMLALTRSGNSAIILIACKCKSMCDELNPFRIAA